MNTINIQETSSLRELKNALRRLVSISQQSLNNIDLNLRKSRDILQQKLIEDQRALEDANKNVYYAHRAVEECEAQEDEDYIPDCSEEYDDLGEAQREQQEAEYRLEKTKRWKFKLEKQIEGYRIIASKLNQYSDRNAIDAIAALGRLINKIDKYFSETICNNTQINTYDDSILSTKTLSGNKDILLQTNALNPVEAQEKLSGTLGKWDDKGIIDVKLSDIPEVNDIVDKKSFIKISMEDMQIGLNRLQEMQKVFNIGDGKNSDYWREKDQTLGLNYSNGYQRVYEAFFGMEPIRVEKNGSAYEIVNGRHRIWLAKKMGLNSLPMSVVEKN
ncbi:MAG: hypothetical protein HQK65_07675 [Desulfamplus sp.]|nr:hypothetical protein [Desulfamplus sp.]